ncbi:prepilin-type N-terminal cleavage/methylation domain-containing protein [Luteimonas sp. XNQY3]|nr:prepilin-type N-terminal cleavage/methylation domain-containing protein [Luteimonas sp. XNQY3]
MVGRRRPAGATGGFTLVELMITLLILALLALAGLPFGHAWIEGNRQMQLRSQVLEGVGQARALALRNPHGLRADAAGNPVESARLDYDATGRTLQVVQKQADGHWPAADAPPEWRSPPAAGALALKLAGPAGFVDAAAFDAAATAFACIVFDTRGRPVPDASGCTLGDAQRIAIGTGDREPLHADLL